MIKMIQKVNLIFILLFFSLLMNSNAAEENEPIRFIHPAGLEFYYPFDWSTKDSTFADVELVPPDQKISPQGPTEAYFLWGLGLDPSQNIDKQIEDQLAGLMDQIASFLKPSVEPESFLGKKLQGLVYTWQGKRPDGEEVLARIFVLPEKRFAFALVALGVRQNIVKRESTVSQIFGSFTFNEVTPDHQLVGKWLSISDQLQTTSNEKNEEPSNEMELNADGSFKISTPTANSETQTQTQEMASSGWWYTLANKIYFVSPGNVALTFRFELKGDPGSRTLDLDHSNGDRQEFHEESPAP
jgi:hypothetical protein